jgi:hypothetical protein
MVGSGALTFVDVVHDPLFVAQPDAMTGSIAVVRIQDPDQTEDRSSMSVVEGILQPLTGHEEKGRKQIEGLSRHIVSFADAGKLGLASMVRSALLLPHVSRLLGFSEYVVPSEIPAWLAYPTLRFAHLVQTGLICDVLEIRAARVPFGGTSLLSAAFNIKTADHDVYEYASFVLSGTYGSNVSAYIENDPPTLLRILKFRESSEGEAFRREISDRLSTVEAGQFSAAIDGGLERSIPLRVLQAARNKFSTFLEAASPNASAAALWADINTDDRSLRLWRGRSRQLFLEARKARGLKSASPCLCGSGDPIRDCCLRALAT